MDAKLASFTKEEVCPAESPLNSVIAQLKLYVQLTELQKQLHEKERPGVPTQPALGSLANNAVDSALVH